MDFINLIVVPIASSPIFVHSSVISLCPDQRASLFGYPETSQVYRLDEIFFLFPLSEDRHHMPRTLSSK
jgi:hypothetical protein